MFRRRYYDSVHKFGGSSLTDAESFRIILQRVGEGSKVIILSATCGTTTRLQSLLELAKHNQSTVVMLEELKAEHVLLINALFAGEVAVSLLQALEHDFSELMDLLKGIQLVKAYSAEVQAIVLSYGECWSAKILAALLAEKAVYVDARKVLYTFIKRGQLEIDWEKSKAALDELIQTSAGKQLVITGFIATDEQGNTVLLGRNGSDFSAAVFAYLLAAQELIIWKDVDGVYSADPARVPQAFAIPEISYESAMELAYFGAKVIHPKTIAPAMKGNIPIRIKNALKPAQPGTLITNVVTTKSRPVQGLTSIDQVGLITIEGAGLIGVSGTAERVFRVICENKISVILISQASSEHSICFAVQLCHADKALAVLAEAFEFEVSQGLVSRISANKECAILAVVGDGMVGTVGVLGRVSSTLAKANVNIIAVAQGSSERNISLVIKSSEIDKALKAVHAGFYLSKKTVSIGLIGPGLIGKTLLAQLNQALLTLSSQHQVSLCVRGICNSKKMLLAETCVDLTHWSDRLNQATDKTDFLKFIEHIASDDMPHALIIDCSASTEVVNHYPEFVKHGAHLVTPNKKMNSGEYARYQAFQTLVKQTGRYFLYEATVCAGLPVMTTLHDILHTGDEVLEVEGVVSGTLSYIFNQFSEGKRFSEIIFAAKKQGYTEPDPRDDLMGTDVARKMVILARELGFTSNLAEVMVTNLVPKKLQKVSLEKFLAELPAYDEEMKAQITAFTKPGEVPVYVGSITKAGGIEVGIKSFPVSHPFARLSGTDNLLMFKTKRYFKQPLVIQGPGAGAEVTAAGVFADVLRLVSYLG